jgi:hypothetical protein
MTLNKYVACYPEVSNLIVLNVNIYSGNLKYHVPKISFKTRSSNKEDHYSNLNLFVSDCIKAELFNEN